MKFTFKWVYVNRLFDLVIHVQAILVTDTETITNHSLACTPYILILNEYWCMYERFYRVCFCCFCNPIKCISTRCALCCTVCMCQQVFVHEILFVIKSFYMLTRTHSVEVMTTRLTVWLYCQQRIKQNNNLRA